MNYRCRILLNPFGDTSAGNSASTSADEKIILTDEAQAARDQGVAASGEATSQGGQNTKNLSGSVDASGGSGTVGGTGFTFGGYGNNLSGATISSSDPEVVKAALESVSKLGDAYNANLSDLVSKTSDNSNSLLSGVLDSLAKLTESKNTEGQSSVNRTILYVALAIAAVFGIWFWRRR